MQNIRQIITADLTNGDWDKLLELDKPLMQSITSWLSCALYAINQITIRHRLDIQIVMTKKTPQNSFLVIKSPNRKSIFYITHSDGAFSWGNTTIFAFYEDVKASLISLILDLVMKSV